MENIQTPAILLDLDILENNIKNFQQMANANNKKLWPMTKTHKSTEIAKMQIDCGAEGFLCGTLDECETVYEKFVRNEKRDINIMYAYPVASEPNISRVIELARYKNFYLRLDNYQQAKILSTAAEKAGVCINYSVIINTGLNRFGVTVCDLENLLRKLSRKQNKEASLHKIICERFSKELTNIKFVGISTHPGHVYSKTDIAAVKKIALQECETMKNAVKILRGKNIKPQFVSSGSTPTYPFAINADSINIFHPGNYVFMDNIQISLGCATENDCALTVLCSVIANPREGEFIIDGGSKCFGLDKGAHGNGKITGHGRVKNLRKLLPEHGENIFEISSLSEEVGKITIKKAYRETVSLKIGDKIEIIPNHSCAAGNNTSYYIATRNGKFEKVIHVDMRGNATMKGL